MESIWPILIGVAFIILQAIAAGNKKKKPTTQRPMVPHSEAAKNPLEQWLESIIPTNEAPPVADIMSDERSFGPEEGRRHEHIAATLYPVAAAETPPVPVAEPLHDTAVAMPTVAVDADEEERQAFAEQPAAAAQWLDAASFDAKKAIIYSEIMRPKFDNN